MEALGKAGKNSYLLKTKEYCSNIFKIEKIDTKLVIENVLTKKC